MSKTTKFIPIGSYVAQNEEDNTELEVQALRPEVKHDTRKPNGKSTVAVYADISCKASDHSKNYCIVVVDNDARDQRCTFSGCDMSSQNISKRLSLTELKELAEIINQYIERESR